MIDQTQDVNPGQGDASESQEPGISPSVRRLLRQYGVDISNVRGTGPNGRIRPGDVLALVSNPRLTQHETADRSAATIDDEDPEPALADGQRADGPLADGQRAQQTATAQEPYGTTVFVCDMTRVVAHRNAAGPEDLPLVCYLTRAAGLASASLTELQHADGSLPIELRTTKAGVTSAAVVGTPGTATIAELRAALARSARGAGIESAQIVVSHHDLPGNLADYCPPRRAHEAGILTLGGMRPALGVGAASKGDSPRVFMQSQIAFSYRPSRLSAIAAAQFVAECVRILESWPAPPQSA